MIIPIIAANFEDECWAESESSDEGVIIRRPSPPPKASRTQHPADSLKCLRCNFPIIPPARYCHTCYQVSLIFKLFKYEFKLITELFTDS